MKKAVRHLSNGFFKYSKVYSTFLEVQIAVILYIRIQIQVIDELACHTCVHISNVASSVS